MKKIQNAYFLSLSLFLSFSPLLFPSFFFSHSSLSVAMGCETNFYHYTLQVKKGSWECVIYARFDFYVGSTSSFITALFGTLVHWAPDEMLSRHCHQSPRAFPSLIPDVQERACIVAWGLSLFLSITCCSPAALVIFYQLKMMSILVCLCVTSTSCLCNAQNVMLFMT